MQAPFTERRFFPFRREPMVLKGVLRISPDRGLSLQYTDPEASVLIADPSGLFLRTSDGRTRELPSGSRETGAIASLLPIMRFDLAALYPRFAIRARRTGPDWVFEFTPHDSDVAGSLGTISVGGTGSDVRHLEFKRSSSQRIEIEVGETRTGVLLSLIHIFSPAPRVLLCGGEERGTWLLGHGLASGRTYAFAASLQTEKAPGSLGKVRLTRAEGMGELGLDAWFDLLRAREPFAGMIAPGWHMEICLLYTSRCV